MVGDSKTSASIDAYLEGLENEELAPWEQDAKSEQTDEWFERAAADFLSKPEVDPTLEEILEATKQFTRKNFALRSGLLYRQQLQNTPSYETIMELEEELLELAGEANRVHEAQANPDIYADRKASIQSSFNQRIIKFSAEILMPKLAGSKVVKVTRSTKKPKSILAKCPSAMFAQLGIKYKELLECHIDPSEIMMPLANSVAGCNVREWMGEYTGRDTAPENVLICTLWTGKERKQWLYGLVEYATELVNLVAHASALDPTIKPRKYLCYFQKKSEATLYRGQEELEALVKNMQADKLLPDYGTGEADSTSPEWQVPYDNERDSAGWDEETVQELDPRFATHATGETNEKPERTLKPAKGPNTATLRLRERMAARRNKQ